MPNNITIYSLDEILSLANIAFDDVTEIKVKAIQNNVESNFAYVPTCNAPVISLNGTTLSWSSVSGASSYIVYVDNIVNTIITTTSVNVSTLSYYTTATHTIKVKASASDELNSIFSNSVSYYHEANATAYLTFNSANTFTLGFGPSSISWDGTIEYSTDKVSWDTWTGQDIESVSDGSAYKIYLRGTNNTKLSAAPHPIMVTLFFKFTGTNIACSGNIETLLDYQTVLNGQHPQMAISCFNSIFKDCTNLISAPSLPATTLSMGCYAHMFQGCTALTTAPALPATTLTDYCYYNMFMGCTALTTAPTLSATTLTDYCYSNMFNRCTALTSAPVLPATALANNCYQYMFTNCAALTSAPLLPATTLTNYCYEYMFQGCTALTSAPALPATTLAIYCYYSMFSGCTGLTSIPELSAVTLANYCYTYMFIRCSNIKLSTTQTGIYQNAYRIPVSGTGTTGTNSLNSMFADTGGTLTGTPTINTTYYTSNTIVPAS